MLKISLVRTTIDKYCKFFFFDVQVISHLIETRTRSLTVNPLDQNPETFRCVVVHPQGKIIMLSRKCLLFIE